MGNPTKPSDLEIAEAIAAGATQFVDLLLAWAAYKDGENFDDEEDALSISELENIGDSLGFDIECVDSTGGYEGEGDYVERIIKITGPVMGEPKDIYVRVTGSYSSYEGTEWDSDVEYVYPREVMVTQYFNDKELKEHDKANG